MRHKSRTYHPDVIDFASGLPSGKSILQPKSAKGRTYRERAKQSKRFDRVRDRSNRDLAGQGKKGISK